MTFVAYPYYVMHYIPLILQGSVMITEYTHTFYDFQEMQGLVQEKLGYDPYGSLGKRIYPDSGEFDDWHKSKGYPETDASGKHKRSSTIFLDEYTKDIKDGKWFDTPYLNFWHWQIERCLPDNFCNDSFSEIYVGIDGYLFNEATKWQMDIQKVWNELFSDIANDYGYVKIKVSW